MNLSLILIHLIPPLPLPPRSTFTLLLLMQILHLPNSHPLRLRNLIAKHQYLIAGGFILWQFLRQSFFNTLVNFDVLIKSNQHACTEEDRGEGGGEERNSYILRHEGNRMAGFSGTSGTANTMNVCFTIRRQVKV